MTTPFEIGSRVVCPDPAGRRFVGLVVDVYANGDLLVDDPTRTVRASAGEVRPVMPRDEDDLTRFGRWWWVDGDVVAVNSYSDGLAYNAAGLLTDFGVTDREAWSGPVQPPPVVRV